MDINVPFVSQHTVAHASTHSPSSVAHGPYLSYYQGTKRFLQSRFNTLRPLPRCQTFFVPLHHLLCQQAPDAIVVRSRHTVASVYALILSHLSDPRLHLFSSTSVPQSIVLYCSFMHICLRTCVRTYVRTYVPVGESLTINDPLGLAHALKY